MLTRIITGVIGIALAIGIIYLGGIPFAIAVGLLTVLGLAEFYRMVAKNGVRPFRVIGILTGLFIVIAAYFSNKTLSITDLLVPTFIFTLFAVFVGQLLKFGVDHAIQNVSVTFFGVFYVAGLMAHFILLRNLENPILPGQYAIWFAFICTWSTDSFAYFVGRSFGKRLWVPKISPKKTWAGFWGGLLGAVIAGFIYSVIIGFDPLKASAIALGLGFVGQLGDLFESALKRDSGVKDSGKLLPGHGGVLDRFDSTLFTLPLTYYLVLFLFG